MGELFAAAGKRVRVMVMPGSGIFAFMRGLDGRAAYRLIGMPADTKCIGVTILPEYPGQVAFLLESKEWEPIDPNSDEVPQVEFKILTALLPPNMRVEEPKPTMKAIAGGKADGGR